MNAADKAGEPATHSKTQPNRHPVDRLGDVRALLKELQEEEIALKATIAGMMGEADSLGGDEYIASQRLQQRKGELDEARLHAEGIDLDNYRRPGTTRVVLTVEPRARGVA
jgi:hypothetical protein